MLPENLQDVAFSPAEELKRCARCYAAPVRLPTRQYSRVGGRGGSQLASEMVAAQRLAAELRRTDRMGMQSVDSNLQNGHDLRAALRRQLKRQTV